MAQIGMKKLRHGQPMHFRRRIGASRVTVGKTITSWNRQSSIVTVRESNVFVAMKIHETR